MTPSPSSGHKVHSAMPRPRLVVVAVMAAAASGCSCDKSSVATVGSTRLQVADWKAYSEGRAPAARGTPQDMLAELVDRELLAEGARRQKLADDPTVRARLAAMERELLAQTFLEKTLAAATTEEALHKRYDRSTELLARRKVHVKQILFALAPDATDDLVRQAQSRALEAYARLAAGDAFDRVVEALQPAGVASDLGTVSERQVDQAFFDVAVALKRGEVSKPFRTRFGFHVIVAVEDPHSSLPSYEEALGQVTALVRRDAEMSVLADLKREIRVTLHEERLPGGAKQ